MLLQFQLKKILDAHKINSKFKTRQGLLTRTFSLDLKMDKKCVFFISCGRRKINDNNTSTFVQSQSHSYALLLNIYGSNKCIEIKVITAS